MTVVISMLLGAGLAQADFEPDLIPDTWELSYYASPLTAAPLDDTDGDTFNTWEEWKAGTSPIDDASFPVNTVSSIRTSDGSGFDGTLIEINGDAEYDGGFVVTDTPHSRNHARQDGKCSESSGWMALRHSERRWFPRSLRGGRGTSCTSCSTYF